MRHKGQEKRPGACGLTGQVIELTTRAGVSSAVILAVDCLNVKGSFDAGGDHATAD